MLDRWHTERCAQLEAQMRELYAMIRQGQTEPASDSLPMQLSDSGISELNVPRDE